MGSALSSGAAIGIGIGGAVALILLACTLHSFVRVRTEVAIVKARLQDVWSIAPGDIEVDTEHCEAFQAIPELDMSICTPEIQG